jgi:hypothetical protein
MGKARNVVKVPADSPVRVLGKPTQRKPAAVPPSHGRPGSGVGKGVTAEARAAIKAKTPRESAKILHGHE